MKGRPPFALLAITPPTEPIDAAALAAVCGAGGPRVGLLIRRPGRPESEVAELFGALRDPVREAGAALLVHEHVELAARLGADGVHLPARRGSAKNARGRLGDQALIGVSRHADDGMRELDGADYTVFGPVFGVPGKAAPVGLAGLAAVCGAAPIPVFALGGVEVTNAGRCREAGAAGIAAIRAVWQGDPTAAVRALLDSWDGEPR